mmetsp:Transcript_20371/g.22629  ORF Transcript_20371/g.22629 Transcript_20371/m.22629 type:complete len:216 (+) Transcript_20371:24-671(+)
MLGRVSLCRNGFIARPSTISKSIWAIGAQQTRHSVVRNKHATYAQKNYFEYFSLPVEFDINTSALHTSFKDLQRTYHPDKFSQAPNAERTEAAKISSNINLSYDTLKDPAERAIYLLKLRGVDVETEGKHNLTPDLLMQVFDLRETLESSTDVTELTESRDQVVEKEKACLEVVSGAFKRDIQDDCLTAVAELLFWSKLKNEFADKIFKLENKAN